MHRSAAWDRMPFVPWPPRTFPIPTSFVPKHRGSPRTLASIFRRIGPGLILASGIVGSGELIATTVLGAEVGYTLLWLIILSCFIKVVVQNELGRHAIGTGETTLEAFDRAPGPRLRLPGWSGPGS